MLNRGQRHRLIRRHDGAFGHAGFANPAGNRRHDLGVRQIDARGFQVGVGLFQGGIVPSYAIIVREYFSPREAGARLGVILMATLFGMAFGGWISGWIFDLTGSYRAAFLNGLGWNLFNVAITLWLLNRPGRRIAATA